MLPQPLANMAGYHLGWWDEFGTPLKIPFGKMMRPALTIAAAKACGGEADAVLPAAAAIELIHNFTLLHDDIMDADMTRRGRRAVWALWGTTNAILLGDSLHALSILLLADSLPVALATKEIARLETAAVELCRGQIEDCAFESRHQVSIDEYLRMAMAKTGALIGCACAFGAICVEAEPALVSTIDQFGRELGLAFQAFDDVIGIWGDQQVTGKPVGGDIARRKRTLPVIAALASGTTAAVDLGYLYNRKSPMEPDEIARAMQLIEDAGGRAWALRHANERVSAAIDALPDQLRTTELLTLANLATCRDG
jgi:geranylgeranyl diphosphate synthase type I